MRSGSATRWLLLAAVLYLVVALYALRAVLPAPAALLPQAPAPGKVWDNITRADQFYSVAMISWQARQLLRDPSHLMDAPYCWPMPHATTLGEHMIGEGLLGVVPQLLFGAPILTYNAVLILMPWIAGLAMFALVAGLTGSGAAALIAGALFAMHPARLGNAAEPYWMGNQWAPLALLCAYRLFTRRRWLDAVGLAFFTSLQLLDSFYPILAFAVVGGVWLAWLAWRERGALPALAPQLVVAGFVVALVAVATFVPYLRTRTTWSTLLAGRDLVLYDLGELRPGRQLYPGTIAAVLALIGVGERVARFGHVRSAGVQDPDPRGALVVGGILVLWAVVANVPLGGGQMPSLLLLAKGLVPGLDAVRVGKAVASGFYLVIACLAGFGVRALLARMPAVLRGGITAVLVTAVVLEALHPAFARATFGRVVTFEGLRARPDDDLVALYTQAPPGPVLDLPAESWLQARYLLVSSHHRRPTVDCYGSYRPQLNDDVAAMADRLPNDPDAAVALAALGVRAIVRHQVPRGASPPPFAPGSPLALVAQAGTSALYALPVPSAIATGFAPLVAGAGGADVIVARAAAHELSVPFRNGADLPYRHPDPIAPRRLVARWRAADGRIVADHPVTGLLPIALAPGERVLRVLAIPVPATAGDYRLTVSVPDDLDQPLVDVAVQVAS
jgi:hypothetical protein